MSNKEQNQECNKCLGLGYYKYRGSVKGSDDGYHTDCDNCNGTGYMSNKEQVSVDKNICERLEIRESMGAKNIISLLQIYFNDKQILLNSEYERLKRLDENVKQEIDDLKYLIANSYLKNEIDRYDVKLKLLESLYDEQNN